MDQKKRAKLFEKTYIPYEDEPDIMDKWNIVKIADYTANTDLFMWCNDNCSGDFSITPKGMAFENKCDAMMYALVFGVG